MFARSRFCTINIYYKKNAEVILSYIVDIFSVCDEMSANVNPLISDQFGFQMGSDFTWIWNFPKNSDFRRVVNIYKIKVIKTKYIFILMFTKLCCSFMFL